MSDPNERRIAPRINSNHPVKYSNQGNGDEGVGYLVNESTSGIIFAAYQESDIGESVVLTMDEGTSWGKTLCSEVPG